MRVIVEEIVSPKEGSFQRVRWTDHFIEPRLITESGEVAALWRAKENGFRERLTVMATRLISDKNSGGAFDLVLLLDVISPSTWEAMEPWIRRRYNYASILESDDIPVERYETWAVDHGVWP